MPISADGKTECIGLEIVERLVDDSGLSPPDMAMALCFALTAMYYHPSRSGGTKEDFLELVRTTVEFYIEDAERLGLFDQTPDPKDFN